MSTCGWVLRVWYRPGKWERLISHRWNGIRSGRPKCGRDFPSFPFNNDLIDKHSNERGIMQVLSVRLSFLLVVLSMIALAMAVPVPSAVRRRDITNTARPLPTDSLSNSERLKRGLPVARPVRMYIPGEFPKHLDLDRQKRD